MTRILYLLRRLIVAAFVIATVNIADAQVVTTMPTIVQQSSSPIVITFHADRGNRGLAGLSASTPVYAHTGVILSGSNQWSYAPAWGNNTQKYRMTYVAPNTYTLTIPSIKEYYGVADGEVVEKLAFVFRNASSTAEGKSESGGDIFVDVAPEGLAVKLSANVEPGLVTDPLTVDFAVDATQSANLNLYVNSLSSTPIASASSVKSLNANYYIDTPGLYRMIATASDGKRMVADTLTYSFVGDSQPAAYPAGVPRMGVVDNGDNSATFCIAAPGKTNAMIIGGWNDYLPDPAQVMNYQDYQGNRYFWITIKNFKPNSEYPYYYLIDNTTKVGDPYARLVLDPWNDQYIPSSVFPNMIPYPKNKVDGVSLAVYSTSTSTYDWQVKEFKGVDKSRLVVYELLIRDFTGTEGRADGSGTIAGVLDKLDYLQSLGVNAIELLPIMEFGGNNSWGYNTNFYFAPDKAYGTPDDYRHLFDEIHRRGMAVILDIVFNQTDGQHPWYLMYDSAKNPFYNGSAPHAYSVLNDWNQDNPLVQTQFEDALKYWISEYHVDGFRFDLVKGLGSNSSYNATYNAATNTFSSVTDAKTNSYNASRVQRMKQLHDAIRQVAPDAYFINEDLAGAQEENDMADDGEINWANINEASCQFAMGYSDNSNLNRFYAPLDSRTWGSTMSYAESHDEERMAYKVKQYGASGVKGNTAMTSRRLGSVAAMMLMSPGAHMIWQFQEFAADQTTKNTDGGNNTDPKRVVWSYLDNANREGLKDNYAELNYIRNANPDMFAQGVATSVQCGVANWQSGRFISLVSGDRKIFLAVNPNVSATATVTVPAMSAAEDYQLLAASYATSPTLSGNKVTLLPGAFAVYGTMNIADATPVIADPADAINIWSADGRIVVEGTNSVPAIYDMQGRRLAADQSLRQGIYVVSVDGVTRKVLVK